MIGTDRSGYYVSDNQIYLTFAWNIYKNDKYRSSVEFLHELMTFCADRRAVTDVMLKKV
jgi:hypothetical protein